MDRTPEVRERSQGLRCETLKEVGKSEGRPRKGGEESPGGTFPLNPIYRGPNSHSFSVLSSYPGERVSNSFH